MSLQNHIDALKTRHAAIDSEIIDEINRPRPDDSKLTKLKREKLQIKERIHQIQPTEH